MLDDVQVGTFCTLPALRIHPLCVEDSVMRDVVRAALRSARTSAVMHVAPVQQPDEEQESSPSAAPSANVAAAARTSSIGHPPEKALA